MAKSKPTSSTARTPRRRERQDVLTVPALEVKQGQGRKLYSFAVDGKLLHSFCTVSRVSRKDEENALSGYQRPEVASHIRQIRDYIESDGPILPNAIVVAFDGTVKFKGLARAGNTKHSRIGHLEIPLGPFVDETMKPGWIVDGQQRSAALRDARVESFPVCVVGFVTDGFEEQRQQFILVNATKPLPKGLIYELLPVTDGKMPLSLQKKRKPAELLERLNFDDDSPLQGMIRTPTNSTGVVADNSILAMLQNSLTDGVLYRYEDIEDQLRLLKTYWTAVKEVFTTAWGLKPRDSRLMHGAGILALGFLMDTIADQHRDHEPMSVSLFTREVKRIQEICAWTEGTWEFGGGREMLWNALQNTPGHVQLLSSHILSHYRKVSRR